MKAKFRGVEFEGTVDELYDFFVNKTFFVRKALKIPRTLTTTKGVE